MYMYKHVHVYPFSCVLVLGGKAVSRFSRTARMAQGLSVVVMAAALLLGIADARWLNSNGTKPMLESNLVPGGRVGKAPRSRSNDSRLLFDDLFFGGDADDERESSGSSTCTCNCGVINQEIRIVGGRPTGVNRYPWVVRLVYDGQFHCGGSLLNADYVLTAAHCVRRLKRSKIRIILGDHDQYVTSDAPAIMRAVSVVIRHRNFDVNTYNHDIALLKMRKPVTFTKRIRPVCLPQAGTEPAGMMGTVVGWGRTEEGGALPAVIQEVQVPILTLAQCRSSKYRASRITANMLCAGKGTQDSCQGDSGGPLIVATGEEGRNQVVGIVSWGVGCGRPGYPGVYTRVTRYLDWLKTNTRDSCMCVR